ncbi:MAG: transposase [Acidimicrobiales bacterium]|nr:transposase [Acidimicrobiales bacterium]MYI09117.1 transposase [Acidimicrobiales bacterium]
MVVERRRVVDAVFCVAATGCQWRALPVRYPNFMARSLRKRAQSRPSLLRRDYPRPSLLRRCQPRPTSGMPLAITVMVSTLVSAGSSAM